MTTPKTYTVEPDEFEGTYLVAKSTIDGSYIGLPDFAQELENRGINAEAMPGCKVASIGFCVSEQKWYGWSHRAIFGFGVGSSVKKGDCGYVATGWDDLAEKALSFWADEAKLDMCAVKGKIDGGVDVILVSWTYASDVKLVPNVSIHGTRGRAAMYPPKKWGQGEWTAETLDDAKQMAIDFAEGVS